MNLVSKLSGLRKVLIILLILMPALNVANSTVAAPYKFKDKSADQLKLIFRGETFGLTHIRSRKGQTTDYKKEMHYQQWT